MRITAPVEVVNAIEAIRGYKRELYRLVAAKDGDAMLNGNRQLAQELLLRIELGLLLIEEELDDEIKQVKRKSSV